jgi:hypothetical protein
LLGVLLAADDTSATPEAVPIAVPGRNGQGGAMASSPQLLRPWTWRLWHWLLLFVAAVAAFAIYWAADFRVMMPRDVQQRLFGTQIAGPFSLTKTTFACCAGDGSGMFEWHYRIPPAQAKAFAARCVLPGGGMHMLSGAGLPPETPYYNQDLHRCVFARGHDDKLAEEFSAESDGEALTIRLFYLDA